MVHCAAIASKPSSYYKGVYNEIRYRLGNCMYRCIVGGSVYYYAYGVVMKPSVRRATATMKIRSNLSQMAADGVAGAAKAHKALNNTWTRRTGGTGQYHKKHAPSACIVTAF